MPKIKIHLLDLAHTYSVDDPAMLVPLGLGYLKAYLVQEMGDEVDVKIFKHPEKALAAAAEDRPDIIGFANYVWNRQLNLKVGRYLKSQLPDTLFIAGGPNIDIDEEGQTSFLKKFDFLDFVITHSGEEPLKELVEWWKTDRRNTDALPQNMVWLEGDTLRATSERAGKKHVEGIPSPYLGGHLDEFLDMGMIPLFETNRGCPFQCTFCAWGMSAQNLVRQFEADTVFQEIDYVGDRSNAVYWIVCDANFGMLKRDVEIAKAIRAVKDRKGLPHKCHVWLAKNVTDRNLEIGGILDDMVVPVMAVQSMDEEVLTNIKRGNISLDTYAAYQQKFHDKGSVTYSDVIIPLPGETLKSHLDGIDKLFQMGVDRIHNHNMWLLPGSEINSKETWEKFGFRTRRRLIHGDEGIYKAPSGDEIRVFEYEHSLRETTTISEEDMFYLRKYHFVLDFCWTQNVYKPLLQFCMHKGISPNIVLGRLIDIDSDSTISDDGVQSRLIGLWKDFDALSRDEWFDTDEEIEAYFAKEENFQRLLDQEFEKLHILFSILIFKDFKDDFDAAIRDIAKSLLPEEGAFIDDLMEVVTSAFPSLHCEDKERLVSPTDILLSNGWLHFDIGDGYRGERILRFVEGDERKRAIEAILGSKGKNLAKVLNTSNLTIRELQFDIDPTYGMGREFKDTLRL